MRRSAAAPGRARQSGPASAAAPAPERSPRVPRRYPCKLRPETDLPDVLEVFAGFEPDGAAGRDPYFAAGAWVAADAALAGLDLKDAKPPQLNAFAALHGDAHGVEHGVDGQFRLHFGDFG